MNNILLLGLILEVAVVGLVVYFAFTKKRENGIVSVQVDYESELTQARLIFEKKLEDLATKYAEELEAIKFFDEIENIEIDISQISIETQNRVLALCIKKSEIAVVLCESSLGQIRIKICDTQKRIANGESFLDNSIAKLKEQERFAMKHLEDAQARLKNLIKIGRSVSA